MKKITTDGYKMMKTVAFLHPQYHPPFSDKTTDELEKNGLAKRTLGGTYKLTNKGHSVLLKP